MQEDTEGEAEAAETQAGEFVVESSNRVAVLERLVEGPADVSTIATDQPVGTASAESASEELRDEGLVELLVTDDERAYGLTAKGERVLFALERRGEI